MGHRRIRRDEDVYESIGWAGDDELDDDGTPDWIEEPRSGLRLVATGAAAAVVVCLAFVLLVALSYPWVESVSEVVWRRLSELGDGGR